MKKFFKTVWKVLKRVFKQYTKDDPVIYAAAIAFFTIFSLPSILIIIIYFAGIFLGEEAIRGEISDQIQDVIGPSSANQIENIIENARLSDSGVWTTVLSVAMLLFSATVIFNFIQKALNSIWKVKAKPKKGATKFLRDRFFSFLLVLVLGILLIASLLSDTILGFFQEFINDVFSPATAVLMTIANFTFSFIILVVIFGLVFKVLPDAYIRWKDAWVGATFTAVLFTIGKFIIGFVLSSSDITTTYAAAGSTIGILLWVFYSSIIFLIGGVFTQVYSEMIGKEIRPKKNSVWVRTNEVEMER
jgi:membrane protein